MLLAQQAFEENNYGRVEELLRKHDLQPPRRPDEDLRGWEWRYLWGQIQSEELYTLGSHSNTVSYLAFSPDGRRLVGLAGNPPYQAVVMDAQDGRTITAWPTARGRCLVLSPDARFAAVQCRSKPEVVVHELDTGAPVAQLPGPGGMYRQGNLRFSPDGRLFANVVNSGADALEKSVDFWSVPDFKLIRRLQATGRVFTGVDFSPDSRQAYLAGADQTISIYDLATWECVRILNGHRDEVWCVACSPDGTQLASGSRDATIRFWSTAIQSDTRARWPLPPATREFRLAEDGQSLATVSTNDLLQVWCTSDFHCLGEMPVPFANRINHSHSQWTQVALAPQGARLAMGGGTPEDGDTDKRLIAFQLPGLREEVEFRGLRSWAAGLAFSPHGAQLAAGGFFGEGQALVWETGTGRLLHTLTNIPGRSGRLTFSPRQTWLAIRLDEAWTWLSLPTNASWRPPARTLRSAFGRWRPARDSAI